MAKIKIKSMANSPLTVIVREIPFRHEWMGEGDVYNVEDTILDQLMYDPGFKYMIDTGMLYIEDMEVKKSLGIEPEDATEPVNVIVLTDKERRKLAINASISEFKKEVGKLNLEQVDLLVDYMIKNSLADFDKADFIKELTGRDVIQAIKLSRQNKEE